MARQNPLNLVGDHIAAGASLIRLVKNEYRDPLCRHRDTVFVQDYVHELRRELTELNAEIEKLESAPPKNLAGDIFAKCGHNTYWQTHFGTCMACRVVELGKELTKASGLVERAASLVVQFGSSIEQEPIAEAFAAECREFLAARKGQS